MPIQRNIGFLIAYFPQNWPNLFKPFFTGILQWFSNFLWLSRNNQKEYTSSTLFIKFKKARASFVMFSRTGSQAILKKRMGHKAISTSISSPEKSLILFKGREILESLAWKCVFSSLDWASRARASTLLVSSLTWLFCWFEKNKKSSFYRLTMLVW